jgi:hypothetical protein
MRRPLVIYDFATAPLWISLYMYEENSIFFFISVACHSVFARTRLFLPLYSHAVKLRLDYAWLDTVVR